MMKAAPMMQATAMKRDSSRNSLALVAVERSDTFSSSSSLHLMPFIMT
jgi:hypothetical protein